MKDACGNNNRILGALIVAALFLTGCGQQIPVNPPAETLPPPVQPTIAPLSPSPTTTPSPSFVAVTPIPAPSETQVPSATATAAPLTFSGKGKGQVALTGYHGGGAFIHATHSGISTFNVLECDAQGKKTAELIVTAGKYDGIKSLDVINPTHKAENLCVTADGDWTFTLFSLQDYDRLKPLKVPGNARGLNSQVFYLQGKAERVTMTYTGTSNLPAYVALNTFSEKGASILASLGAGDFVQRVFILTPGTLALEVDADYGSWVVEIK